MTLVPKSDMRNELSPYSEVLNFIFQEIRDRYRFCDLFGHRAVKDDICEYCYRSAELAGELTHCTDANLRARELQVMGDIERAVKIVSEEPIILSRIEEILR